ncbi:MAG: autotransporter domain-containing protein, partial [Maricaulis sp.]|nr:autotransporter domain-containing protein [Maricaulis sp.]
SYRYFEAQGVEIVNNSWELGDKSERGVAAFYQDVLPYARSGGVLVFSTGNNYETESELPALPAGLPRLYPDLEETWLAVTGLGPQDERGNYAQICGPAARWCLAAPGGAKAIMDNRGDWVFIDGMNAAEPGGGYLNASGTSFAAPMVTGALAITREIYPDADMLDLRKLVLQTTLDIGDAGIDRIFGWGKLDLGNVVETISPYGRSIFAGAAYNRQIAMEQVSRLPFGPLARSQRLEALWAATDLTRSELAASGPIPGTRAGSRAFAAGMDLVQRDGFTAGAGIAYSFTSTSEDSTANTASGNGFYGFGYADWSNGAWYAKGTAGLGSLRQRHTRRTIPGLAGTAMALDNPEATSATRGTGIFSNVEAGRAYHAAIADFTLFGRLFGSSQKMRRFSEDGLEIFGYTVEGERLTSAMAGPGLRVSRSFPKGGWTISPEVELSYARAFGDTASTLNSSLLDRPMEASTVVPGRNVFGVGAKLSFTQPQKGFTASVSYNGSFRKNVSHNSLQFGLSFAF